MDKDEVWKDELRKLLSIEDIPVHDYYGEHARFGVLSDTHYGSLYANRSLGNLAYKTLKKEGVRTVYHCGDICDGEGMYHGQEYEIYAHGADAQVNEVVKRYPEFDDMTTYFITGGHDRSFWKRAGIDIGEKISAKRKDLVYLGPEEMDVVFHKGGHPRIRLSHPGKGTAYALSYHPQKYVEAITGGEKPDVILFGHYHKAEHLPCLRNIEVIQAGCMQHQTPFMRRNNSAAHQGFWLIDLWMSKRGRPRRFKGEFFPYYGHGKYKIIDEDLE